ncbi:MAG: septal ring lytic transglycosylase RlpA family protein [Cardiobacteriaceae bacterium]|nr:septal ring lytic transglycosylase RlpA family protein [Cardiobacteriaceae bacterium]
MKHTPWIVAAALLAGVAHAADSAPLFNIAKDAPAASADIGTAQKTGETRAVKLKAKPGKKVAEPLFASTGKTAAAEKPAEKTPEKTAGNTANHASGNVPPSAKKINLKTTEKKGEAQAAKKVETPKTVAKTENTPAADSKAPEAPAQADNGETALFKIASYYEADEMGDSDDAVRKIDFSKPQGQQLPSDSSPQRAIADSKAIQRAAPASSNKKPARKGSYSYVVRGKRYQTLASSDDFVQEGSASWYGPGFHGKKTASGEIYDMHKMTAAHKRLPLGTKLEVTHKRTGKTIIVTVNDRGPFHGNRIIDLSHAAASQLGVLKSGVADVTIRAIK